MPLLAMPLLAMPLLAVPLRPLSVVAIGWLRFWVMAAVSMAVSMGDSSVRLSARQEDG